MTMNDPTIISMLCYDKKVEVTLDHSDVDLEELFNVFTGILITHTFSEKQIKDYIIELGKTYEEELNEKL